MPSSHEAQEEVSESYGEEERNDEHPVVKNFEEEKNVREPVQNAYKQFNRPEKTKDIVRRFLFKRAGISSFSLKIWRQRPPTELWLLRFDERDAKNGEFVLNSSNKRF